MSTGDQVFDNQVDAAYQAVERLLDTRISSLPWKQETYRQRATAWFKGLATVEVKSDSNKEPDEIKLVTLKSQIEEVQSQVNEYEAEANGSGFFKWCKRAWRWLFGEKSEITLKRYWLSYQKSFSLMKTLHQTTDAEQRKLAGKQLLQDSFFENLPSRWRKAFQDFKKWIPPYLSYLQSGETTMPTTPSKEEAPQKKAEPFIFYRPRKKVISVEKTVTSKLEEKSTTGYQSTEAVPESKSDSLPLSSPSHDTKDSNQFLPVATVALKDDLKPLSALNKHPIDVDKKEINTEEEKPDPLDLKNYMIGCGLLNLDPFNKDELLTLKKVRSHCRDLRKQFHTDPLELEKKTQGVKENIYCYDHAIEELKAHFSAITKALAYLEAWFEKYKKAPVLSAGSIPFSDYGNYREQYQEALTEYTRNIANIKIAQGLIGIGKKIHDLGKRDEQLFEEMRKMHVEKMAALKAKKERLDIELAQQLAEECQSRIVKEEEMCKEIAEMKEIVGKVFLFVKQSQEKVVVPVEVSPILSAATSPHVSDQKEQSSAKALPITDPVMQPEISFDDVSIEQPQKADDGKESRSSSPARRVTRELYKDVFQSGAEQPVVKPRQDFSPSPV